MKYFCAFVLWRPKSINSIHLKSSAIFFGEKKTMLQVFETSGYGSWWKKLSKFEISAAPLLLQGHLGQKSYFSLIPKWIWHPPPVFDFDLGPYIFWARSKNAKFSEKKKGQKISSPTSRDNGWPEMNAKSAQLS
jgi:hypothetical protein